MRFWKVAHEEGDEQSYQTAMKVFGEMNSLIDSFRASGIDPSLRTIQAALLRKGIVVDAYQDGNGTNILVPRQ